MSIYLDLLPPPQFDRSLVAYTVGNFQRVKDALLRASNRIWTTSVYASGPYPLSWTINTPFRADVLLTYFMEGYTGGAGLTGVNPSIDGVGFGTFFHWFSTPNEHTAWSAGWIVRSQAPGNHAWGLNAGAGLVSDANDHPGMSWIFVEV